MSDVTLSAWNVLFYLTLHQQPGVEFIHILQYFAWVLNIMITNIQLKGFYFVTFIYYYCVCVLYTSG